ncbi:LOW QUALITY PROTEIN: WD40 domain-containing protein, partial [Cephalotus follicularis]
NNATTTMTITDLNDDSLAHCASYLSLQDISNVAMSCHSLQRAAYSDSIWQRLFREQWPQELPVSSSRASGVREAYLSRHTVEQFKFVDPLLAIFYTEPKPFYTLLLGKNDIIFSQDSSIRMMKPDSFLSGRDSFLILNDHNAHITCMRLYPLSETSLIRTGAQGKDLLVTSSADHSFRLWWKGSYQRCCRGHNGPVSTLSDQLLGDSNGKLLASSGEDGTIRLWSLSSSGKCGKHALKATFYRHEKPVKLVSVSGHSTSLLVTISNDSKVRVWDTTTSSAVCSSSCVGMTSLTGSPVDMKCHESLLYVASGSSVVTIDLRTMKKVTTRAIYQPLCSLAIMPIKSLICTGGIDKAILWDIRRSQETLNLKPMTELDGHTGPVTLLHMDPYKIVTGGPDDLNINIWGPGTATQTNSFSCFHPEEANTTYGCSAMAVNGCQIVTASYGVEQGVVRYWDFSKLSYPVAEYENEIGSKFWAPRSYLETD